MKNTEPAFSGYEELSKETGQLKHDALEALDRIDLLPIHYDGYDLEADIEKIRQALQAQAERED